MELDTKGGLDACMLLASVSLSLLVYLPSRFNDIVSEASTKTTQPFLYKRSKEEANISPLDGFIIPFYDSFRTALNQALKYSISTSTVKLLSPIVTQFYVRYIFLVRPNKSSQDKIYRLCFESLSI